MSDGLVLCCPVEWGPSDFDDDRYGPCAECGTLIHWRPHNPEAYRKVCIPCGSRLVRADIAAGEEVRAVISGRTLEEVRVSCEMDQLVKDKRRQ